MTVVLVPDAPDIPDLHFRTYAGEADVPAMTRVMNAATEANGNPEYQPDELVLN